VELWDGVPPDVWKARVRQEREEERESVRRHRPRVTAVESDGKYLSVSWTNNNGERVEADFKLIGWRTMPGKERADLQKVLASPPRRVIGRHPKDPRR
jgi:hypothetical protein